MKNIQLIIFDFDGTLCDTKTRIVETLQNAQAELGFPVSPDDACAATIGLPLEGCFKQLLPDLTDEQAVVCCATYRRLFAEANKVSFPSLFPNVMETIQSIAARGIWMAIASSRAHASIALFCDRYELNPYIELIVGSDDVKNPKPNPDPVLLILEKTGITAQNTLVVGDMTFDILMGSSAGAHTCGVTFGNGTREELTGAGAQHIIDRITDLPGILD